MKKTNKKKEFITRVEKHQINKKHELYGEIDAYAFLSKNLYNRANYLLRQVYIICYKQRHDVEISEEQIQFLRWVNQNVERYNVKKKESYEQKKKESEKQGEANKKEYQPLDYFGGKHSFLGYDFLHFLCQKEEDYTKIMAQSAQQVLRLLCDSWKSYFALMEKWFQDPSSLKGRPKLPKYKKKDTGRYNILFTNQNCGYRKNGFVVFPKCFHQYQLQTKMRGMLKQVRIKPFQGCYELEIVYGIATVEKRKENEKYISIDLGLDNLATVANNIGASPFVINGKGLKSWNQYYNKRISHYQQIAKQMNGKDYTKRMRNLTRKRTNQMRDYMNKASRYIVDYAVKHDISRIVIGMNKDWKTGSEMSALVNQAFVQIPYRQLIDKIAYKGEEKGIIVIETEESYTSGTSFLDEELPVKEYYNKTRRKHRGLFISNHGVRVNADVNAALQILKKVFPNAYANGIGGRVSYPAKVNC